jgi:hypothetical protein
MPEQLPGATETPRLEETTRRALGGEEGIEKLKYLLRDVTLFVAPTVAS